MIIVFIIIAFIIIAFIIIAFIIIAFIIIAIIIITIMIITIVITSYFLFCSVLTNTYQILIPPLLLRTNTYSSLLLQVKPSLISESLCVLHFFPRHLLHGTRNAEHRTRNVSLIFVSLHSERNNILL